MTIIAALSGSEAPFVHWGVIQVSVANLVVVALMLIVFVLALLVPFHGRTGIHQGRGGRR